MNKLFYYLKKCFTLPPNIVIQKIYKITKNNFKKTYNFFFTSYFINYKNKNDLENYINEIRLPEVNCNFKKQLLLACDNYLKHYFDLLGSGWVKVHRNMTCHGSLGYLYSSYCSKNNYEDFKNSSNYHHSKRISEFLPKDYKLIDWHIDFKSGFRWHPKTWYSNIKYGHLPGVDVKVPWELSRLQHLPQLAIAYGLVQQLNLSNKNAETYALEFRNQILDFIASNPPCYGVNWSCTMDVGIRAANILVAYDLFCSFGLEFEENFKFILNRSIYEHGIYIENNLEWSKELRGNHYLADIAGLLFIAAYLPECEKQKIWLAFAIQEFVNEVDNQFQEDGTNFEASTSYHRLSAEMVAYCGALIIGLPSEKISTLKNYNAKQWKHCPKLKPSPIKLYSYKLKNNNDEILNTPLPISWFKKLKKIAEFTFAMTKHNHRVPQIGDNDSGRFLKLLPIFKERTPAEFLQKYSHLKSEHFNKNDIHYLDEDHLDHHQLICSIIGIIEIPQLQDYSNENNLETLVIKNLTKNRTINTKCFNFDDNYPINANILKLSINEINKLTSELKMTENIFQFTGNSLKEGLIKYSFPCFGLFIFKSNRLFFSIRAGSVGQLGNGGHAHNDQLSIELQIDGKDIIADPGTGVYTSHPEIRNSYRSIHSHFAPAIMGKEHASLDEGLFKLPDVVRGECLLFTNNIIACRTIGMESNFIRLVIIENKEVVVRDYYKNNYEISIMANKLPYSNGYGKITNIEDAYKTN